MIKGSLHMTRTEKYFEPSRGLIDKESEDKFINYLDISWSTCDVKLSLFAFFLLPETGVE